MNKYEIQKHILKILNIESEQYEKKELSFYCNDGNNRFFIKIKDK